MFFFALVESGWFWLLLWLIGGTICVAFDSDWFLLALSVGVLAGLKWLAGREDLFTLQTVLTLAPWVLAYVPCGVVWSFVKWFWLLLDFKDKLLKEKYVYEKRLVENRKEIDICLDGNEKNYNRLPRELAPWKEYREKEYPQPIARKHKAKICRWIAYWPLSIVNSICYDFVKRFFSMVYECLGGTYDKITARVLKGI